MRRAVLAGMKILTEEDQFEWKLNECEQLCRACGIEVVAKVLQTGRNAAKKTMFRAGKLEELAETVRSVDAELVVFMNELSVAASGRIHEICDVEVIDRTTLILDIFALRARTKQARLQVEAARLSYALPSMIAGCEEAEHNRGGSFRSRGAGEMRSAQVKRRYQARIKQLKEQLDQIEISNRQAQIRRGKSSLGKVALVGYTNAGKSSLLNAVQKKCGVNKNLVLQENMLFATLDTSVRQMTYDGRSFLMYDTVGFVSDLPHQLVDAFHSTLDSAREADLLIHVKDASDPLSEEKAAVTLETLRQIHADAIEVVTVCTKSDLLETEQKIPGLCVSSVTGEGLDELLKLILDRLYPAESQMICLIPYAKMGLVDAHRKMIDMTILEQDEVGMRLLIKGPAARLMAFEAYRLENNT